MEATVKIGGKRSPQTPLKVSPFDPLQRAEILLRPTRGPTSHLYHPLQSLRLSGWCADKNIAPLRFPARAPFSQKSVRFVRLRVLDLV